MKQMKLGVCASALGMFVAIASGSGCDAETDLSDVSAVDNALTVTWTRCASAGQLCSFSGTRRVRYTASGSQREISATNGVQCTARAFGAQRGRRRSSTPENAYCEVATETQTMPPVAGGSAPSTPSGGAGGKSSAGGAGGTGGTGNVAGAGGGAAGHPASHASGSGPYIDVNAIPTGSPGSGQPRVGQANDAPGPSDGVGAFRTVCDLSHMNFDDPIVYPGQPGKAHLHAFFGNTGANASSTAASLASSGNSTCLGGTINRTAYWVPALIDAAGKPVKPLRLEPYYKSGYGGIPASAIKPFPAGLRMIAGDANASSAQSFAYWGCRDHYIGHPGNVPTCNPGEDFAMIVEFPQCWDGKNLDSADHRSHMAYPRGGSCPSTHPVPIPVLTMNVIYASHPNPSTLRLASDVYDSSKPGGYSAHADWYDGWQPAIVNTFVTKCINPALDCHSHLLGDGRAMN